MLDITFVKILPSGAVTDEISFSKMIVTGREKLAHEVVRALLNTPGTLAFNSEYGGGFSKLSEYAFEDTEEAKSIITGIISTAERSVKSNQAGQQLPAAETLKQIKVGKVELGDEGEVLVDLYLVTAAGVTYSINLEV